MTPSTPRLVAVWTPDWPVAALTLEAGRLPEVPNPALDPVAVVGGRGVIAASAPARATGIARGMRLRVARSLCPELIVLPPQPDREARAFETVMEALSEVLADPIVARPGLALSPARGPARWAGDEETLAAALVEAVAVGPGVECQVGIADSLLGAILAARRGVIVPPGATPAFLAPWPLASLQHALATQRGQRQARPLLEDFERLGLHRLGDLAALPRRDVTARFGPAGEQLHRLASGDWQSPPRSARPAADVAATALLDPPIDRADAAAWAARSLAEDLSRRLVSQGMSAGRLRVEARCENGEELARSWLLGTMPSPADLTDRVRWQLEGWLAGRSGRPPAAPLTRLRLTALELIPAGTAQAGLWSSPGDQAGRRARRAAERLESLLGVGGVRVPVPRPGRDPRSRVTLVGWGENSDGAPPGGTDDAAPWAGALPAPSPALVPPQPLPALLLDADGHDVVVDRQGQLAAIPVSVELAAAPAAAPASGWGEDLGEWRGRRRVRFWAGPWPVDEHWWRPGGASRRAYLQIVTDTGPPLLLARAGRWWLDGLYS
ncbi:DNA polymerase Y family protein [Actinomyces sp. MRS3W]|uniref:DNA polymerase Y family protein n=1 Tax=Actinomyces sp. MRS3W TaxID=2800796 RepID=UPI0028FD3484|nr:DNA polymerase Y family protein [Actinomyces sp. MRS3W]MDU0348814.1 DNA polymerase Y family protein [Actinomyces sp. MRS3W]